MKTVKPEPIRNHRGRMDFKIEAVRTDDKTQMVYCAIVPEPRRYTTIEVDGEKYFLDKYLRHLISAEEMQRGIVQQMAGLPVFSLSPSIDSTPEYAARRRPTIVSDFRTGQYTPSVEQALPHRQLEDDPRSREIVFLSIDICGSTARRRSEPKGFDEAYKILLRELGAVVGQFNGAVWKPTGDGFIALVDFPAFTSQCDAAIDLGISLLVVLRDLVNPALEEIGLSPLKLRIGADYGTAEIHRLEVPATGFSKFDVASDALNRAVKIEKSCGENEFRIGYSLYELIHVQWLERAKEVPFDGASVGIPDYKVYEVN